MYDFIEKKKIELKDLEFITWISSWVFNNKKEIEESYSSNLLTSCSAEQGWFGTRGFSLAGESKVILLAASARESELVLANLGLLDFITPKNNKFDNSSWKP